MFFLDFLTVISRIITVTSYACRYPPLGVEVVMVGPEAPRPRG